MKYLLSLFCALLMGACGQSASPEVNAPSTAAPDRGGAARSSSIDAESEHGHIQISAKVPERTLDGERYEVQIAANLDLWLIVYRRRPDGSLINLLPDHERVFRVSAGDDNVLPPVDAHLVDARLADFDTLVIYAFDSPEYAETFAISHKDGPILQEWEDANDRARLHAGSKHFKRIEVRAWVVPGS